MSIYCWMYWFRTYTQFSIWANTVHSLLKPKWSFIVCLLLTERRFTFLIFKFLLVKKMDIYRICRTCLNESHTSLVSIHSAVNVIDDGNSMKPEKDGNDIKIAHILDDVTENKYVCIFLLFILSFFIKWFTLLTF